LALNSKFLKGYQFGTIKGVFTPSILTILGVVMYLRFGWVLGQVGLWNTLLIVTLATAITFLTSLAISELATNMRVGGGGAYYIISRSLGIEAGAAIGIPLFFAQALGISFYITGFSESVVHFFPNIPVHQIGIITLIILAVLAIYSADLALKIQFIILALITSSLISFFLGSWHPPIESHDIMGSSMHHLPFWSVFAVFFPAVTGIEAGLSMSGDLKDPSKSLPLGTIGAIIASYLVYLAIPIYLNHLNIDRHTLITDTFIFKDVARWEKLIFAGLWGAALSSAMGALLGAPRTLQALARDSVIPKWVGRGFGSKGDPRIATVFSFGIALLGILLGDLNIIAPILSMFFLTSYGLLNLSAALNGILNNPSWRPKFRVHWIWPLAGFSGCVIVMFMINPGATFIAYLLSGAMYYVMKRRKLSAYWGDIRYGVLMLVVRFALYRLTKHKAHEQTWRPNILVLSGIPTSRWYLIALADAISHGKGFLTVATILSKDLTDGQRIQDIQNSISKYLEDRDVPAIVKVSTAENVMNGARELIQNYGFGALIPNTVLLGDVGKREDFESYASLILTIFRRHRNLVIVREQEQETTRHRMLNIDLWWRRIGENSGLMLVLAYQLKTSPEWKGAKLIIKTIVNSIEEKQEQIKQLTKFIEDANVEAEVEIYILNGCTTFEMIKEKSRDADIVFLGMKVPDAEEMPESYSAYYGELLRSIENLPTTALVLTAEKIDFKRIFQLREA